jgi:GNAT superfamily N-acetyltransferase
MDIRQLHAHEREQLLALYIDLHGQDEPLENDVIERVWQKILHNPNYLCMGGFVGSELVTSCCLIIIDNLTRGGRPYALIENVVTHHAHRRQGHGHQLLKHCLTTAWERGCYKVMLMSGRLDENTMRFYERAGFDRKSKQAFIARQEKSH